MVAAGPAPSEFMTDRVEPWLFEKLMTSSTNGQRFGSTSPRGWSSKQQPAEVTWMDAICMMAYTNAS